MEQHDRSMSTSRISSTQPGPSEQEYSVKRRIMQTFQQDLIWRELQ